MVALGLISNHYWVLMKDKKSISAERVSTLAACEAVRVAGDLSGADDQARHRRRFHRANQLHVIVNQPTAVELSSEDVIHSFFVPEWRVKQDAVPGMHITAWFQATKTGEYEIGCAELCGMGHYKMRARVFVHTPDEYKAWVAPTSRRRVRMTTVAHTPTEAHHAPMSFWRKYIFSTDHKIIGIQFLFVSLFFLLVGGFLAMQIRWQLGFPGKPLRAAGFFPRAWSRAASSPSTTSSS